MKFEELVSDKRILKALVDMGYQEATEIQKEVILNFKNGEHLVGQSQTGTGKTAAFLIPILENIKFTSQPEVLILTPTRELAFQIREEIFNLTKYLRIRSLAVYGGSSIFKQKEILGKRGVNIVVGTPGRVIDLINRGYLKTGGIKYFVLDEVDRMLDMGFVDDIDYIRGKLENLQQTMTFSATFPAEIKAVLKKYLGNDYKFIKVSKTITVKDISHGYTFIAHSRKLEFLEELLVENKGKKILVFAETKKMVVYLHEYLESINFPVTSIHGDLTQRRRFQALESFKTGKKKIMIATDVAARGLNMNNIHLVINYDVPINPENYIHRIGRTGRAGKKGEAITLVTKKDFRHLKNIERKNKIKIDKI